MGSQGQEDNFQDAGTGGDEIPEFTGSDVVDRNTRVISLNLFEILQNPDAPQWDSGSVLLNDGYLFQLWSYISPAPENRENESLEDFTARQRLARTARLNLLANRARRTRDALKAYEEANPPVLLWKYNMVILSTKARGAFYNYDTDISMHRASLQ